jgi:hypothetical protein
MKKYIYFNLFLLSSILLANSKTYPQDVCYPQNPNYCTECRDESKRDFAKCGEVDYRQINVIKEMPIISEEIGGAMENPDIDKKNNLLLFSADVSNEEIQKKGNSRYDIFISDLKGNNQKRITFDSVDNRIVFNAFFTIDRRIGYIVGKTINKTKTNYNFYVIDKEGKNKLEVSRDELRKLYIQSHGSAPKW